MDFQLTEEQQYFRRMVRDFAEAELKPRARHTDEPAEFNWPAVKKMGPIGLLGLNVPEDMAARASMRAPRSIKR